MSFSLAFFGTGIFYFMHFSLPFKKALFFYFFKIC